VWTGGPRSGIVPGVIDIADLPSEWSLCPLDASLRPSCDPAPLLRAKRPLPEGSVGAGVVVGPISGVWAGPVEGAPRVVVSPVRAAGLYPARGTGKGWLRPGEVVPVWGPGVEWLVGAPERGVAPSERPETRVVRGALLGDPGAVRELAAALGVSVDAISPSGWEPATWPAVPPPIPWELAPAELWEIVEAVATSTGYSVSGVGVTAAGLAAAALGGRVEVEMRTAGGIAWVEKNPGLYTVIAGPSSARKSPVFDALLPPWQGYMSRQRKAATEKIRAWEQDQAEAREALKKGEDLPEILEILATPEPHLPSVLTLDATPAAFSDEIAREAFTLYASPEASTLFTRCVGEGGATDLAGILGGYAGDPSLPTLRIGRKTAPAVGSALRAGVVGGIQPSVLFTVGKTEAFTEQGLLARVLWACWDGPSGPGGSSLDPSIPVRWAALLGRFFAIPGVERDAEGYDRGTMRRVAVSARGTERLLALAARMRERSAPGQGLYMMRSWCGKAHGQAARLAALFALVEDPRVVDVADRWVEAAIRVVEEGCVPHAATAWALTRWPPATQIAVHLWMALRGVDVWTAGRVAQRAGEIDLGPGEIRAAIECLVDRGFLRKISEGVWYRNPLASDPPVML
jgi:hypothetical protein